MSHGFEERLDTRLRRRPTVKRSPLETVPIQEHYQLHGTIPNTPLVASFISFVLGSVFTLGFSTFVSGGSDGWWWATHQLAFFSAAWAAFHWAEFAVTAGWNLEKCSVDCELKSGPSDASM